jgi:hypothetical protein
MENLVKIYCFYLFVYELFNESACSLELRLWRNIYDTCGPGISASLVLFVLNGSSNRFQNSVNPFI